MLQAAMVLCGSGQTDVVNIWNATLGRRPDWKYPPLLRSALQRVKAKVRPMLPCMHTTTPFTRMCYHRPPF